MATGFRGSIADFAVTMDRRGAAWPGSADPRRMLRLLSALPPPSDPAFPASVRRALDDIDHPEPNLLKILEQPSRSSKVRFAALYALLLRMRREERFGEYGTTVHRFEDEFGSQPYYHTFRAIAAQMRGDLASLRSSVEHSRQAAAIMPDVAAVVHQLAAFWVEYLERIEKPAIRDVDEVERLVDRAIALPGGSVAHYFETKARALALRGEFEMARACLARAIELEPRASLDYLRRLTQYQAGRVRIELQEQRSRWLVDHQRFRTELAEFKVQQLQLLGLLAAVVAFIATASNIAGQAGGSDGIRLMLVASGSIAVVFGTFSLVNNARLLRVLMASLIGFGLIGVGMFLPAGWMP